MVVVAGDADVAGAAVVHVRANINIAFDAIEHLYFITVSVFPLLVLWPISRLLLRFFEYLFPMNLSSLYCIRTWFGASLVVHVLHLFLLGIAAVLGE